MGRFRTYETLLLLLVAIGVIVAGGIITRLGWGWTIGLAVSFLIFAYLPLAVRLQDRLLERYLARGRYDDALRLAMAIRDAARVGVNQSLAEFEVGIVHLSRGANADALRSFRRVNRSQLKTKTRLAVASYTALAELRNEVDDVRSRGEAALPILEEALKTLPDDPYLLAARGEALIAAGKMEPALESLRESLELSEDPNDPSPGERLVLLARAAKGVGDLKQARQSYQMAANLRVDGPFVRAARAELAALESDT